MISKKLLTAAMAITLILSSSLGNAEAAPETIVLSKDNLIVLNSEINGESTAAVISQAKKLDAKLNSGLKKKLGLGDKQRLRLWVNSPGGSIQSGLEMSEALNGLGRPVDTITMFSASMAFQMVQNLGERMILKNGVLMSHHANGEFSGYFGGRPTQLDARYKLWLDRIRELDEQTVKRTNGKQTYDSYTKEYDNEMWLTGTNAVKEGYADRIVLVKCDESLSGVTTNSIEFFGVKISYDLDDCPLNTTPMNVRIGAPPGGMIYTASQQDEIKQNFLRNYESKQKQVVPMHW